MIDGFLQGVLHLRFSSWQQSAAQNWFLKIRAAGSIAPGKLGEGSRPTARHRFREWKADPNLNA